MGKHGQLVMGPAGSGKSTYCNALSKYCEQTGRTVHVVNLDPAAEHFSYPVSIDIRDLISLNDVVEELNYGPNGGLIYCMEYLLDHLSWLSDAIEDFGDDYLIFDLPGQIELYTHLPVMQQLVGFLSKQCGYTLCAIYCLDSLFITDPSRFVSGTLMCLSAMIHLELPHINLLTKCDLVANKKSLRKYCDPDMNMVEGMDKARSAVDRGEEEEDEDEDAAAASSSSSAKPKRPSALSASAASSSASSRLPSKFSHLTSAISSLIDQYSMVNFFPLDITQEESMALVMQHVDRAIGYGEDLEPKEPKDKEHEIGMDSIAE